MPFELIYTSAPRGLKPGTVGFATVAKTRAIPPSVAAAAEALSAFRGASTNGFAAFSQLVYKIGGANYLVFSRVADAGLDYSGRSNYIAHHWAFDESEATRCDLNPSAFWAGEGAFFRRRWTGPPEWKEPADWTAARRPTSARRCDAWAEATGDAGWAAVFAATAFGERRAALIVPPDVDLAALFWEALALIPPRAARNVSFAAPFFQVPFGVELRWRGAWSGTPNEATLRLASRDVALFDASAPGRVPIVAERATPEDAAALLPNDPDVFARIDAARSGRACEREDRDERDGRDAAASAPPPTRRVAVPNGDLASRSADSNRNADASVVVDLRRLRAEKNARRADGDGFSTFETERLDANSGDGGASADESAAATERLSEIYARLAAQKNEANRPRRTAIFGRIAVAAAFSFAVVAAFYWLTNGDQASRDGATENVVETQAPRDVRTIETTTEQQREEPK